MIRWKDAIDDVLRGLQLMADEVQIVGDEEDDLPSFTARLPITEPDAHGRPRRYWFVLTVHVEARDERRDTNHTH